MTPAVSIRSFTGERDAVQWTEDLAARDRIVCFRRLAQSRFRCQLRHCIELRVYLLDPPEVSLHDLVGGEFLLSNGSGESGGQHVYQFFYDISSDQSRHLTSYTCTGSSNPLVTLAASATNKV